MKCTPNLRSLNATCCLQPEFTWQFEPLMQLQQLRGSSNAQGAARTLAKLWQLSHLTLGEEFQGVAMVQLTSLTGLRALQQERKPHRDGRARKPLQLFNKVGGVLGCKWWVVVGWSVSTATCKACLSGAVALASCRYGAWERTNLQHLRFPAHGMIRYWLLC